MAESDSFAALQERFAEVGGRIAGMYGATPLMGRLYGILYLSLRSMSLEELATAAGTAKSTASVALRKLESARMVQRHWRKGDRRDHYTAQTDFAELMRAWYEMVFQHELRYMTEAGAMVRRTLQDAPMGGDWPSAEDRAMLLARLEHYEQFMQMFLAWMSALSGPECRGGEPTC